MVPKLTPPAAKELETLKIPASPVVFVDASVM
jgi:hypothetical protein